MRFQGKVVLVTGASSGIGAAAAKLFVQEGANVVMVSNQEKVQEVAKDFEKPGSAPLALCADLTNDKDVKRVIKETIDKFGKLDILVNNAGIFKYGSIVDGTVTETFDQVMNTNFRSPVFLTALAVPYLIKTKGNIVNISSMSSTFVQPKMLAYSASKAAITNFTQSIAQELAPYKVRANSIAPGPVKTNILQNSGIEGSWEDWISITALKRASDVEEVAELIAFLASDAARGITGSEYVIDNGAKLLK